MKQYLALILVLLTLVSCKKDRSDNTILMYNPNTGLPMNCRAIIKENIDGYKRGEYTAEEALGSIDRNCGEFGYSWSDDSISDKDSSRFVNNM